MLRLSKLLLALLLLLGLCALPVAAQEEGGSEGDQIEALRQEIVKLQAGQAAMRRQLTEIKNLVAKGAQARPQQPVLPDVEIDLKGSPFLGEENAPITVVEFSDYQ